MGKGFARGKRPPPLEDRFTQPYWMAESEMSACAPHSIILPSFLLPIVVDDDTMTGTISLRALAGNPTCDR